MENQERYLEKNEVLEEGEDATFLHHTQKRQSRHRRWFEGGVLILLSLSIFLNILTHISNKRQDLDDVCSVYTSQSGKMFIDHITLLQGKTNADCRIQCRLYNKTSR